MPFYEREAVPAPKGYETAQLVAELSDGADEAATHSRRRNLTDVEVDGDCYYAKCEAPGLPLEDCEKQQWHTNASRRPKSNTT